MTYAGPLWFSQREEMTEATHLHTLARSHSHTVFCTPHWHSEGGR
jgi:hypothetical protein